MFTKFSIVGVLLALLSALPAIANPTMQDDPTTFAPSTADEALINLVAIGTSPLKVLFWEVYESELFTRDGEYRGVEPDLALNLVYRRTLTNKQLVNATEKEWDKLSGPDFQVNEAWLPLLLELWPNVEADDEILLYVDNHLASHFYFNGNKLGTLQDAAFTEKFLAIWLSPQTSYPNARKKLLDLATNNTP